MFDFLGRHPRGHKEARLATLATLILATVLAIIAVSLFVSGNKAAGLVFGAVAVMGALVNLVRMRGR